MFRLYGSPPLQPLARLRKHDEQKNYDAYLISPYPPTQPFALDADDNGERPNPTSTITRVTSSEYTAEPSHAPCCAPSAAASALLAAAAPMIVTIRFTLSSFIDSRSSSRPIVCVNTSSWPTM